MPTILQIKNKKGLYRNRTKLLIKCKIKYRKINKINRKFKLVQIKLETKTKVKTNLLMRILVDNNSNINTISSPNKIRLQHLKARKIDIRAKT